MSFDVVDGGVIVPPQTRACVFQAADCQASPSGVWGLDPVHSPREPGQLAKDRTRAEASITESLKISAKRSKGEDAELQKEQSDFKHCATKRAETTQTNRPTATAMRA